MFEEVVEINIGPKKFEFNIDEIELDMSKLDPKDLKALSTVSRATLKDLSPLMDLIDTAEAHNKVVLHEKHREAKASLLADKIESNYQVSKIVENLDEDLNGSPSHGPS